MSADPKPDPVDEHRMPLVEHLKELRQRLLRAVGALLVGVIISFFFTDQLIAWVRAPLDQALLETGVQGGLALVNSPFEGVSVWMRVAVLGGLALASPVIAYQIWAFVAPGLYQQERRVVLPLTVSSTALFLGGGLFCYYVVLPRAFPFLLQVIDVETSLSLEGYLASIVQIMIAFGICFQLPIVTWFLARLGLVDARDLIKFFRYAVVLIFVVAAIVTPDSSMMTQLFLAAPLTVLYGVSIGVAWVATTKKREVIAAT